MKLNLKSLIIFFILLSIEIFIAIFIKQPFIRYFFGDFLVVILLFYFFKSFFRLKPKTIAILVIAIAFFVEFMQYFDIINLLNIKNRVLIIIIGTTFSFTDLIAYVFGTITALLIEKYSNYDKPWQIMKQNQSST